MENTVKYKWNARMFMHAKGAIGALGLAMRESYLKVMRISILLSAPLIDPNENNVASP